MSHLSQINAWLLFLGTPLLFLAVVAWIYRSGAARRYREDARIPFEEDSDSSPGATPKPSH